MTVRRALISVSDKSGLVVFARGLAERGVDLLSTGGTLAALEAEGVPARSVESYTGSPEVMGGRVKTLHPRVHGGILGREGIDDQDLLRLGGAFIDLVVVNLYPFEQVLTRGDASFSELIENIDVGGPSMLRSAAKNHARVGVVSDPADYAHVLAELDESGRLSDELRERLAAKAFAHTAAYDAAISGWLSKSRESDGWPSYLTLPLVKAYSLRYGENPHQRAAFYRERGAPAGSLARATSLNPNARELSFNNLVDVDAALEAVREFEGPSAVVIKHATVCGAASAATLAEAYRAAREADALSAFGGIVALNRPVDDACAALVLETFLECVVAPSFSASALATLGSKKSLRLLATETWLDARHAELQYKRVGGGLVVQSRDAGVSGEVENARVVTTRQPSPAQLAALAFAWRVCKHVKSNAIVLARSVPEGLTTVGIGGGQTSRVDAVALAAQKAGDAARDSVLASDAFFPFPDGVERAAAAGVVAIAQPGGSRKDADVIAAAERLGLAMVFTGARHFRH